MIDGKDDWKDWRKEWHTARLSRILLVTRILANHGYNHRCLFLLKERQRNDGTRWLKPWLARCPSVYCLEPFSLLLASLFLLKEKGMSRQGRSKEKWRLHLNNAGTQSLVLFSFLNPMVCLSLIYLVEWPKGKKRAETDHGIKGKA